PSIDTVYLPFFKKLNATIATPSPLFLMLVPGAADTSLNSPLRTKSSARARPPNAVRPRHATATSTITVRVMARPPFDGRRASSGYEDATLFLKPPKPCLGNGAALHGALGILASETPNDHAQQRRPR